MIVVKLILTRFFVLKKFNTFMCIKTNQPLL